MLRRLAWWASDLPEWVARCCFALVALASGFVYWQAGHWYGQATAPRLGAGDERASAVVVSARTAYYGSTGPWSSGWIDTFYTVRFTDTSGIRVEAESRCNDGVSRDTGDHVEVYFEREDPRNVCIADAHDDDRLPILHSVVLAVVVTGTVALALIAGWFAVAPWG